MPLKSWDRCDDCKMQKPGEEITVLGRLFARERNSRGKYVNNASTSKTLRDIFIRASRGLLPDSRNFRAKCTIKIAPFVQIKLFTHFVLLAVGICFAMYLALAFVNLN